jgi:hypothetical protein
VCLGHHYRALERFAHAELAAPPDAPGASLCAPARAHAPRARAGPTPAPVCRRARARRAPRSI